MVDQESQAPPSQENQSDNTAEEIGIIQYPDGGEVINAEWLVRKSKHLNDGHKTWFEKPLLNIQDNDKLYKIKQVAGTLPNGTTIPVVTEVIDTMVSRLVPPLASREIYIEAVALDPDSQVTGDYDKQELIGDFINESITLTEDLEDKLDETIKMLLLENVTFVETSWRIDKKDELTAKRAPDPMIPTMSADPSQPAPLQPIVAVQPKSYELGRPDLNPLSMTMCAWDPRVKDKVSKSPWFRKRTMVSINGLLQLEQEGVIENVSDVIKKAPKAMTPENPSDPDARRSQAVDGTQLPSIGWDDGVWELDTWWADLAWKDSQGNFKSAKYEFWIVGGDTVVKFRPNILIPQRVPIVTIKASRMPNQLLGIGPVDIIKEMQKALNNNTANLEQLIKNASYSPTFYTPSSGMDGRRVSLQSNSLIPVLDVNGIKRFEPAVAAIDLIQKYMDFLIGQMREATAANDQSQGIQQGGSGDTTATEASILAQGSNTRFGYLTEMINVSLFAEVAEHYFYLWKQFGEPGKMIVKDGSNEGKGYAIQPEDLAGCYIFKPIPTQSEQAKMQKFGQLSSIAEKIGAIPPGQLVDNAGKVKTLDLYGFLTGTLLPLAGVQPRGLFKDAPPPPMPMGIPGTPQPGADAGPGIPPAPISPLPGQVNAMPEGALPGARA